MTAAFGLAFGIAAGVLVACIAGGWLFALTLIVVNVAVRLVRR